MNGLEAQQSDLPQHPPPSSLRHFDVPQLTVNHSVATPANWTDGDDCMVVPSLSDEQVSRRCLATACAALGLRVSALCLLVIPLPPDRCHVKAAFLSGALAALCPATAQTKPAHTRPGQVASGSSSATELLPWPPFRGDRLTVTLPPLCTVAVRDGSLSPEPLAGQGQVSKRLQQDSDALRERLPSYYAAA